MDLIDEHKAAAELMVFSGLRISEAFALRVRDVQIAEDGRSGVLMVEGRLSASGARGTRVVVKSQAGDRRLPFRAALARTLSQAIDGRDQSEWLFPNQTGKGPQNPDNWRARVFAPAVANWSLKAFDESERRHLRGLLTDDRMRLAMDLIRCHQRVSWKHVAQMRWADLSDGCRTWTFTDFCGEEHRITLSGPVAADLRAHRDLILGQDARRPRVFHARGRHGMGLKVFWPQLLKPLTRDVIGDSAYTPHALRHVWATNLIAALAGEYSRHELEQMVAYYAGHTSFDTTRKIYYHELQREYGGYADTAGDA